MRFERSVTRASPPRAKVGLRFYQIARNKENQDTLRFLFFFKFDDSFLLVFPNTKKED
jgi:hypothetical protein